MQPDNIDEAKILELVNNIRKTGCTCGSTVMPAVPVIVWNDLLKKAAVEHSKDMNAQNYFSHTSKDGRDPGQRITEAGYSWSTYAENIAQGYSNEEEVIEGWKKSEGHCQNMMNSTITEMGVGKSGGYWTQVFAKR